MTSLARIMSKTSPVEIVVLDIPCLKACQRFVWATTFSLERLECCRQVEQCVMNLSIEGLVVLRETTEQTIGKETGTAARSREYKLRAVISPSRRACQRKLLHKLDCQAPCAAF